MQTPIIDIVLIAIIISYLFPEKPMSQHRPSPPDYPLWEAIKFTLVVIAACYLFQTKWLLLFLLLLL